MPQTACIRVWTRDNVPPEFTRFATLFDDGDISHNTVFVAHVPARMLVDRTYQLCERLGPVNQEESWFAWEGRGLFGTAELKVTQTFRRN